MTRQESEQKAREICLEMEQRMRAMGVITTAHYDAGAALIAQALLEAAGSLTD